MIKVLLAMQEGVIPRNLHFETPNPRLDWETLPVRVTAEATPWPSEDGRPARAGVSSFGFSGTNAHLILERRSPEERRRFAGRGPSDRPGSPAGGRPPRADDRQSPTTPRLLPLSARTHPALSELAGRYLEWLENDRSPEDLADAAWTAGIGRSQFRHRAGLVFRDGADLRDQLALLKRESGDREPCPAEPPKLAFLFTGQGSQWPGMGRTLYECEPAFREVLDRCEAAFLDERGFLAPFGAVRRGGESGPDGVDAAGALCAVGGTDRIVAERRGAAGRGAGSQRGGDRGGVGGGRGRPGVGAALRGPSGGADGGASRGGWDGGGIRPSRGCRGGVAEDERARARRGTLAGGGQRDALRGQRPGAAGFVALAAAHEAGSADGAAQDEPRIPQRAAGPGRGQAGGGGE